MVGLAACRAGEQPASTADAGPESADAPSSTVLFGNMAGGVAYVGDDGCFSCHEDLYRGYQEHGMARSYYPLTKDKVVEDLSGTPHYHAASNFYYRAYEEDGRYYQEEYRLGADGRKTHRLVREMKYVVGSGTAARTYLDEQEGRLYELPLTWYTQPARWDFSPGYAENNARFDRLVPDRCMACHNSYPTAVPFVEGKYEAVPNGIGCERCHGPGALHVEERLANPDPPGEVDSTIVNPSHLAFDRRLDVCQQCHLQTTVSVLREGRTPFDFRPGQALADYVAFFAEEEAAADDRVGVISHADRMKQSACFLATRGQAAPMECVTCHNPHEGFRDKGPAYFNDTCLTCHAPASLPEIDAPGASAIHNAEANCISCHMPRVEVEDAPHSSFTDHLIRVVEELRAPTPLAVHQPVVLEPYFARDEEGRDGNVYEGMAYVVFGRQNGDRDALMRGAALLTESLASRAGHGEAHFLLGIARLQLEQTAEAIPALEEAVRLDPDVPERLNALAQAYEAERRDPVRITRLYERALALQPALAEVRLNYGRLLEAQGRMEEAVTQYSRAAEEQPWLETTHYNLGTAYLRSGDFGQAEAALLRAIALDPDFTEALGNLGLLYVSQGKGEQARVQFERALAVSPDDPVALGNLGTYYLNADDLNRAIDLLSQAVEADPRYLNGLLNLALAHFRNDDMAMARQYAEQALQVDPGNANARQILDAL